MKSTKASIKNDEQVDGRQSNIEVSELVRGAKFASFDAEVSSNIQDIGDRK